MTTENWKEEFEKRFGSLWSMNRQGVIYGGNPIQLPSEWTIIRYENMTDFISTLLSKERKKVLDGSCDTCKKMLSLNNENNTKR